MIYTIETLRSIFAAKSNPVYELGIMIEIGDVIDEYYWDEDGDVLEGLGDVRDWDDICYRLSQRGIVLQEDCDRLVAVEG